MTAKSEKRRIYEDEEHELWYCTEEAVVNGLILVLIVTAIVAIIVGIVIDFFAGYITFLVGALISLLGYFFSMCIICEIKSKKKLQEVGIPRTLKTYEILTESEERRIREIFENQEKRVKREAYKKIIAIGIGIPFGFFVLWQVHWRLFSLIPSDHPGDLGFPFTLFTLMFNFGCLFLYVFVIGPFVVGKCIGWKWEWGFDFEIPYGSKVGELWKDEAYFLVKHLENLGMRSRIDEVEFKNYLDGIPTTYKLRRRDQAEIVEIFRKVKERVKNNIISEEFKMNLTPWEFFRDYFFKWWVTEQQKFYSSTEHKYSEAGEFDREGIVYGKVLNYFQEFDKAPRISGDLAVELEDFLGENKDIIPVSKDEIMKLVEAWRRFKTEAALA